MDGEGKIYYMNERILKFLISKSEWRRVIGRNRFAKLSQRSRRKAWLYRRRMCYAYLHPEYCLDMKDAKRWFDFDTEILSK